MYLIDIKYLSGDAASDSFQLTCTNRSMTCFIIHINTSSGSNNMAILFMVYATYSTW